MKLTRASNYALHAVVHLAVKKSDRPIASHNVAQACGIFERFLLKVLKPLVSVRVLTSIKGPNGGYKLAKPANEITVLEIVEAVDGDIRGLAPFSDPNNPSLNKKLDNVCAQAAVLVREHLGKVKVSDLMGKRTA